MTATALQLRNVYTCEQFAAEVLCGNRHPNWVRDQIKKRKIKAMGGKPYMIPMSEALRFINAAK